MKTFTALLALALTLVTLAPAASAAGKLLCSENPGDDIQFCVAAGTTTSNVRHVYVSGATSFCIVFGLCVPMPTTGPTTTTIPDVTLCGTYYHEAKTGAAWAAACPGAAGTIANSMSALIAAGLGA